MFVVTVSADEMPLKPGRTRNSTLDLKTKIVIGPRVVRSAGDSPEGMCAAAVAETTAAGMEYAVDEEMGVPTQHVAGCQGAADEGTDAIDAGGAIVVDGENGTDEKIVAEAEIAAEEEIAADEIDAGTESVEKRGAADVVVGEATIAGDWELAPAGEMAAKTGTGAADEPVVGVGIVAD